MKRTHERSPGTGPPITPTHLPPARAAPQSTASYKGDCRCSCMSRKWPLVVTASQLCHMHSHKMSPSLHMSLSFLPSPVPFRSHLSMTSSRKSFLTTSVARYPLNRPRGLLQHQSHITALYNCHILTSPPHWTPRSLM
jgi:hypothetical protein